MTHESSDLTIHHHPHHLKNTAIAQGDVTITTRPGTVPAAAVGDNSGIYGMRHPFWDGEPLRIPEPSVLDKAWHGTCVINETAGNLTNSGWAAADHQIKIIESEFEELKEGIATRDEKELRDGIADLLFTVIGLAHRLALPSIADLAEVVRSNLTKFDTSEEDAIKTRDKYLEIQVVTYYLVKEGPEGTLLFVTYSASDQIDTAGKKYIANKWLKSYKWEDVNLAPLPAGNKLLPSL